MTADDKAAVRNPASAGGPAPSLSELKQLGKYIIERKIGAGGMGTVFLARDSELKRTVALKVLPRDKAENPILVRRFRAEAQAAAQLRHPNIVAVFDSGEADGYLYIAMEYVEGRDLFEMVTRRGVVPVRRSIDIVKQVAAALQHAYEQNIVHRDIKPSNLLIRRDGVVKLTDLGLARSIDDTLETNITRAGTTVGTVDYMAPEQARNSKLADIRSDLYSLGCTWYQMLTGSPPFPEGSVTNKLQAHAIKAPPDPRDKNPNVPEGLTAVIGRMMAKKPDERYQTPAELIDELDHATLTQASISREIFSDLSDYDQPAISIEDDPSDDGYFDDVRETQETPDASPQQPMEAHRKTTRGPAARPVEETQPVSSRKTSHRAASGNEPEAEEPAAATRRFKPIKPDANAPAEPGKVPRSRAAEDGDDTDPDPVTRKSKPRADKPESPEHAKPEHTAKGDQSTKAATAAKQTEAARPKGHAPKAMPPKREPLPQDTGDKPSLVSKDLLRYLAAAAGGIVVIVGLGWLISSYGTNIDSHPPAPPIDAGAATQPVVPVPGRNTTTTAENTGGADATSTTSSGGPNVPRTDQPAFDIERIPQWAGNEADTAGLPALTVSEAPKSATNFTTLSDALQAVTSGGAVIRLQGTGPFPLPLVELAQRKRIVITGATPQDRPVITLKPGDGQTTAGLKVSDTTLDLRSVHFSIDRALLSSPTVAVEVNDGQLLVRQCSFTSGGVSSEPAIAMVVSSSTDSNSVPKIESTLLVDRVVVRGDGLAAVAIRRANVDAVIRDSLMVCGSTAAIELGGHVVAGVTDVTTNKPRRILRIQRSTLIGQNRIFDLSVDEAGKPPQTAITIRDSICAAQGVVQNSAIVFAGRWPQIRSNECWLSRLSWNSTACLYLGFEQLIDLGSSYKVLDAATWQRVWNSKIDARQFQKISFPEGAMDDLSSVLPQEFDTANLSYREVKSTDGSLPGCATSKLVIPDTTSQHRAVALMSRPSLPAAVTKPANPAQVRKVDLRKEDLGLILSRGDWPSGTQFEATGGGICYMTPVKVDSRSLRIVLKQADGAGVRLQPQQPKGGDGGKPGPTAMISISGGTLELTNMVLEGHPNAKGVTPEWMVHATDSTVILNGCRLLGSEADGTRQQGLLRWETGSGKPASEQPALVIRDSFLAGTGTGIRLDCDRGAVILRNSIVAVRGDAVDLRPRRVGNGLLPVFDAEFVTFSATSAALRFEAAAGTEPVGSPLRVFVERCVFAPPLAYKPSENANTTLLQCVGPVIEQQQLEWWGSTNGVARKVVHLVRRDGDSGPPSEERTGTSAWKKLWDKGGSIRLLTGDKGVYLTSELPARWKDLKPTSFDLHKGSQAVTWAEGGRPIGANPQAVEDSSTAKRPGEAGTGKPNTNPNVSTKKNIGF